MIKDLDKRILEIEKMLDNPWLLKNKVESLNYELIRLIQTRVDLLEKMENNTEVPRVYRHLTVHQGGKVS